VYVGKNHIEHNEADFGSHTNDKDKRYRDICATIEDQWEKYHRISNKESDEDVNNNCNVWIPEHHFNNNTIKKFSFKNYKTMSDDYIDINNHDNNDKIFKHECVENEVVNQEN